MMEEYNELLDSNFRLSYENSEISEDPVIEIIDCESGMSASRTAKDTMLFFVMEGTVSATCGFAENRLIETNHFFLIPPLASYTFSFPKDAKLYCCHLTDEIFLCRKDKPEFLSEVCGKMKLVDQDSDLFVIRANSNIISVLNSSSANIRLGLQWADYLKTIIRELQILISVYYSDEELACLFNPIFKGDIVFKSIVLQNRNKLTTVEEFAAAVHLNRNSFRKRFTEIFGINPSDWIINNRAEQVINELKKDKPIANIVHNCGFSSYPNFVRFCRNFLHNTPAALRKQIKSSENPDLRKILRRQ
jgi:AraC-like DNA-binding protein